MGTRLSRSVGFLTLIAVVQIGVAQCDGWSALDGSPEWHRFVQAVITWDPDGPGPSPEVLVVGGMFNTIAGIQANNVATWDGASWQPLGSGPDMTQVYALCVYNGELIAGGHAVVPGNTAIARWDGSNWTPVGGGVNGFNVSALIVYNGELAVGGDFTMAGGIAASYIATWNGSSWQPVGTGVNSYVRALAVYNGELIVGGIFSQAGGVPAALVARWDGSSWHALSSGLNFGLSALETYGGELYAGGVFDQAGGLPISYIARWNGSVWQAVGGGVDSQVRALRQYAGSLVAGGYFAFAGGVACNRIARWNGSVWQPFGSGLAVPGYAANVQSIGDYDGALIAGGQGLQLPETPPGTYVIIAKWSTPPGLDLAQPGGAGTGVVVTNTGLIPGHEYYNIASFEICAGGPGSGPWGGLCFSDLSFLYYELAFPVGFHPFHFIAGGPTLVVGPYDSNPGTLDAVCADVTGGTLGCISNVTRFTIE